MKWSNLHVIARGKRPGHVVVAETKQDERGYLTDIRNRREVPEAKLRRR
jgi:hypothetical protein